MSLAELAEEDREEGFGAVVKINRDGSTSDLITHLEKEHKTNAYCHSVLHLVRDKAKSKPLPSSSTLAVRFWQT